MTNLASRPSLAGRAVSDDRLVLRALAWMTSVARLLEAGLRVTELRVGGVRRGLEVSQCRGRHTVPLGSGCEVRSAQGRP
jgi:hypothetical protein